MAMQSGNTLIVGELRDLRSARLDTYQDETRKPIVSLVFILPVLVIYELGALGLNDEVVRNGVDAWMRQLLSWLGFGQYLLLPLLTTWILLVWHRLCGERWRFRPAVLGGMAIESTGLALILFCAAKAHQSFYSIEPIAFLDISGFGSRSHIATTICYLGAGIYEEFLFRLLILLPLISFLNKATGPRTINVVISIVLTSFLFAGVHYQFLNPAGATFELSGFLFRYLASIFFCVLFLFRGFGIAVGVHALYDVLTQV